MLNNKTKYFFIYWFPIIIYCLLIYLQSSRPAPENVSEIPNIDKILHVIAYGLLGALFLRAFRTLNIRRKPILILILSMTLSTLYGISDEFHQAFVPGRCGNARGFLFDFIGIATMATWLSIRNIHKFRKKIPY